MLVEGLLVEVRLKATNLSLKMHSYINYAFTTTYVLLIIYITLMKAVRPVQSCVIIYLIN